MGVRGMDREAFSPETLTEPRARHAYELERMAAFAQREHFLERPMFLTAPAVGRFAVQNSQRLHYYGEIRVNLDGFKVNGAERRMPGCWPCVSPVSSVSYAELVR